MVEFAPRCRRDPAVCQTAGPLPPPLCGRIPRARSDLSGGGTGTLSQNRLTDIRINYERTPSSRTREVVRGLHKFTTAVGPTRQLSNQTTHPPLWHFGQP